MNEKGSPAPDAQPPSAWLARAISASSLITLAGYFGPWVPHQAAGLVITGLDLSEYVKFLPSIRSGQIRIWREGFYLPLVAVSVTLALYAFRKAIVPGWALRVAWLVIAAVCAANLLPPAWSPGRLFTAEFRLQTATMVGCLLLVATAPFWSLLPNTLAGSFSTILAMAAAGVPALFFLTVLPAIADLYHSQLTPGWGFYATVVGSAWLGLCGVRVMRMEDRPNA